MSFGPLETDRLVITRPEIGHAAAFHERRNHPDAARYQSWTYPYPLESARTTMAGAAAMHGPADDEWWMMTIVDRASDVIVGDLAMHQTWQGRAMEIGYTLHPDHWGSGYATEAVGAVVDALVDRGVRRFSATTHPDNLASVRVLERVGFEHEGRTVGSYFEGDGSEAEASDDLLFGMTASGRSRWAARPLDRPERVRLVEIDDANHRAVAELATHYSQRHLVAPVEASFSNALFPPVIDGVAVRPWLRAIEIDQGERPEPELTGFVMLALPTETGADPETGPDTDTDPPATAREPYLWRLLIDRFHQRRGIASAALDQIEDQLAADGHRTILVHWEPGPGTPEPFYRARGYEPTGRVEHGEIEGRKRLG